MQNDIIIKISHYSFLYGSKIIIALLIFFIGKVLAKHLTNIFRSILSKSKLDETIIKFLGNLFYIILMVLVIISVVGTLGVQTTSFIALIGSAGIAVGLALQGSLSNVSAGVLLIILRPFRVGNYIEVAGSSGIVEEIHIFYTVLRTLDNQIIFIPNSKIASDRIVNYSTQETRRTNITISVSYESDLKIVKQELLDIVNSNELILKDPTPTVSVSELADSSVNLSLIYWVKTPNYLSVYGDILEKIKLRFDEKGINIPYPQRYVHLKQV